MNILLILVVIFLYLLYNNNEQFKFLSKGTITENPIKFIQEDVVCLIGIWGRLDLVQINIDLLKKQTKPCKILLIVSSPKDKLFAIKNKVDWIYTDNQPLGKKWQIGLYECKKYNPNAILINGSDDLLSPNWIEKTYPFIKKHKYDIVGKSNWYLLDLIEKEPYKISYKNNNILLGAGRLISRNILDEINWNLFPLNQRRGLDSYCNRILDQHRAKRYIITNNNLFIISLKGKYDTLNTIQKILLANKKIKQIALKTPEKIILQKLIYNINRSNSKLIQHDVNKLCKL